MIAVVFDMDGVIIDSEPIHAQVNQLVLSHIGVQVTQEYLNQFVGVTNPEMWRTIIRDFKIDRTVEGMVESQLSANIKFLDESDILPINGISELIKLLNNHHIPIGIASSAPRLLIERVLAKFEMQKWFQCIVSGEEVKQGKPAPDVYLEACRMIGAPVEKCIAIEDSRHGVLAAKRAGLRCIGYQNENSGKQDLSDADVVVRSISEITLNHLTASHRD